MGINQSKVNIKIIQGNRTFTLNLIDETASFDNDRSEEEEIIIPTYVEHENILYYVTSISPTLLYENKETDKIKSIRFSPDSKLMIIGGSAFQKTAIESILIPSSVTKLGQCSFLFCSKLKRIEFEKDSHLQTIGQKAFLDCPIEQISIPSSVTEILEHAFSSCIQLRTIDFQIDSQIKNIHVCAFGRTLIESISIPSDVELISGCFYDVKNLKEIKIYPREKKNIDLIDGKYLIGKTNFKQDNFDVLIFVLNGIKSFTIPSYITEIGSFCFTNTKIKNIIIPNQVTAIKNNAFYRCKSLQKVEFQKNSNLKVIGYDSFYGTSITKVFIPESTTTIERSAFYECDFLEIINFPPNSKLETIDEAMIKYRNHLKSAYVPKNVKKFKFNFEIQIIELASDSQINIIDDSTFEIDQKTIIMIPPVKIKIPKFNFVPHYGW